MSQTNDVSSINAKGHCCSCVLLSDLVLAPDTKFGDIPSMKEAHKLGRFNIFLRVALTIILLLVAESSTVSGTDHIGDIAAPPSSVGYAYDTSPSPLSSLNGILGTKPSLDDLNLYILSFARVVFEPENHNRYPWILMWPERVEIRLRGKIEPRHSDLLQQVVGDLSRITGMPFVVDGPSDDLLNKPFGINILVTDEYVTVDDDSYCMGERPGVSFNGEIFKQELIVSTAVQGDSLSGCFYEDISQALGFYGDEAVTNESMYRSESEIDNWISLTWHDVIILRTLYDKRLKPGMHLSQALPIVRVIIGELLEELNTPAE